jgi:hypothetical protein
MRRLLPLLAIILCSLGISKAMAQEEREYVPFVEEGKVWYCGYEHPWPDYPLRPFEDPNGEGIDCTFTMCGDTLVNDMDYKKVICQFEEYYGDGEQHYYCAIREENYQVFIIEEEATEEKLIYDFSNPGEQLTLTYNGYQLVRSDGGRRWQFLPGQLEYSLIFSDELDWRYRLGRWVEGVGAPFVNPFAFELNPVLYEEPIFGIHIAVRSCIKDGQYIFNSEWMAVPIEDSIDANSYNGESPKESHLYDLQGRQLRHAPTKGVYIQDGKKFIK